MLIKNLIVDVNNLVFSIRHGKFPQQKTRRDRLVKETIFISALESIAYTGRQFGCTRLVLCEDGGRNWRKDVCKEYKANRELDSYEDPFFQDAIDAATMLTDFVRTFSAGISLKVPMAEADDIIAVWTQESHGVENIIMSSDTDFVQLISETTKLYSSSQKCLREAEDPQFELFVKCVRGDKTDNLISAYPRIRKSALEAVWNDPDPYAMLNFLNTTTKDGRKVSDQFDINMRMIDLTQQPQEVRDAIVSAIEAQLTEPSGKFDEITVAKFLTEAGLREKAWAFQSKSDVFMQKPVFRKE